MSEKLTMLVVDDVEVNRVLLRETFRAEYEVMEAVDGVEAMQILRREKVDIVILDLFMPNLDGCGVLRQMKLDEELKEIPVVVKTAVDENMEGKMLELGADDFIFSPLDTEIVRKRVNNLAQKYVLMRRVIQKEREEEKRLNQVREYLIAQISEELQKPILGIIKLACEAGKDPAKTQDNLVKIEQKGEYLRSMVDDILKISDAAQEEICVKEEPFHLKDVVSLVSNEMYAQCKKKGVHFKFDVSNVFHENLVGDSTLLRQIWLILLESACKYTDCGGYVRTSVQERKLEEKKIELIITVQDNGGEREFPLVRSLVSLLGGTVAVTSEGGKCATFMVRLPYVCDMERKTSDKKFTSMRAMIFDDDEIICNYHTVNLTRLGIQCEVAESSDAALRMLRQAYDEGNGYDICFINWHMENGIATIRKIREFFTRDMLLIVTASDEKELLEQEMKNAGVDYVLEKPVMQSALYQFMAKICKTLN